MTRYLVDAEKVELRTIIQKINASGKIQPEESVQITSTITGWITEITVMEGDTVEPGQHLISIDEKQIRPRYNNALSQVKSSEANLKKVKAQMERTKTLFSQKLIFTTRARTGRGIFSNRVKSSRAGKCKLVISRR